MQVESPAETVSAYTTQLHWLEHKLEKLKKLETPETDPAFVKLVADISWCRTARDRMKEIINAPKGYLVLVLRSKVAGLQGKVGRVTYVNDKHNFATVSFDGDSHSHNLGMSKLEVINLPTPSVRVPAAGMRVTFTGDPQEYVAINWSTETVFVEPMSSVRSGDDEWVRTSRRVRRDRTLINTINGVYPM